MQVVPWKEGAFHQRLSCHAWTSALPLEGEIVPAEGQQMVCTQQVAVIITGHRQWSDVFSASRKVSVIPPSWKPQHHYFSSLTRGSTSGIWPSNRNGAEQTTLHYPLHPIQEVEGWRGLPAEIGLSEITICTWERVHNRDNNKLIEMKMEPHWFVFNCISMRVLCESENWVRGSTGTDSGLLMDPGEWKLQLD